jgi:hypothetical protein
MVLEYDSVVLVGYELLAQMYEVLFDFLLIFPCTIDLDLI